MVLSFIHLFFLAIHSFNSFFLFVFLFSLFSWFFFVNVRCGVWISDFLIRKYTYEIPFGDKMEKNSISALLASYKTWVRNNPNVVTDVETALTWSSYFVAGKINKSPLVSELVYSVTKLICLHHDQIIREAYDHEQVRNDLQYKLKLGLTVLNYSEVFIELAARKQYGIRGKWSIATILQITKCIANLILLYKYRNLPILHPPIPMLQRKLTNPPVQDNNNSSYRLKRSGRTIRKIDGAPPLAFRDWQPVTCQEPTNKTNNIVKMLLYAETIHIMKPLIHLLSIKLFGKSAWKQWLLALGLDLGSLNLYKKHLGDLTYEQKLEMSRRKLSLILYLLRNPVYEIYSRRMIENMLNSTSRKLPFTDIICGPIIQYLNHWQDIYFYMWSS